MNPDIQQILEKLIELQKRITMLEMHNAISCVNNKEILQNNISGLEIILSSLNLALHRED